MPLQQVHELSGIDANLLDKIEKGERVVSAPQLLKLAQVYELDETTTQFIALQFDDNFTQSSHDDNAYTSEVAERKIAAYNSPYLPLFMDALYTRPIALESRRYIGSKTKLINWIMETIKNETADVHTFFDVFAGTGVVTKAALHSFEHVITNDFLHSNHIIYKAFFEKGYFEEEKIGHMLDIYNKINPDTVPENYFSTHFGGKYFDHDVAKLIGFIRQDIENRKSTLTPKEYCILIATLIYNIDRLANTVGHFDAYIKKPIKHKPLKLRMIEAESYDNIKIYKQDSNLLARELSADIAYIDPPYNSRQYCRFYHLYETLVKWDMPKLYGVALKPAPENMSLYCTTQAVRAFEDLVSNLKVKYIVVSYNNTYNSKSSSSENKITLDQIKTILEKCGPTHTYECMHRFFNTGKTDFKDHKEILFITAVNEERKRKSFTSLLCG